MIEITECDFSDKVQRNAVKELMNHYMNDAMGGHLPSHPDDISEQMLKGLETHPSSLILLAKSDDEYIGLCNCFINFGTFAAKPFINIHDIVVYSEYRNSGTGRKLLEAVVKKADELNCGKITLEVRKDNIPAQKLYQSMGFSEGDAPMFFWSKYL